LQFENYNESQLKEIINKYGEIKGIYFQTPLNETFEWTKKRRYCILIFLKNPVTVEPFNINKTGFGNACAWICIDDVNKIKTL